MLTYCTTTWVETQKRLKWRHPDRWTREAAEWNPGLIISTQAQRRAGRPKDGKTTWMTFVTDEETEATQSTDLKNNSTWLITAKNIYEWEKKEIQYAKHVTND